MAGVFDLRQLMTAVLSVLVAVVCTSTASAAGECQRLWLHRASITDHAANSSSGALAGWQQGAGGVEVDILYDPQQQRFIVAHDWQAAGEHSLLLSDWLSQVPQEIPLWLDAKNLGSLWPWQISGASQRLKTVLQQHQRLLTAIVESRHPWYLRHLQRQGIATLYRTDLKPYPDGDWRQSWHIDLFQWLASVAPFSGVSLSHGRFQAPVIEPLIRYAPVYLSTVRQAETAKALLAQPQVAVVLAKGSVIKQLCQPRQATTKNDT
ncbi:hypothetical protein GCM10011297_30370 [Bacterioplanes sanyensis]|uniref:hypothetical protein n=1 Tax=Bacterioplanes sanyensis TaxID=1249553 RepID=UPI001671933E|nr:hypothetical protein [Bacterioplanes sanyensis]GGY55540.1 hypothetical protein GCM10011297_30370 [Bacterioplanes sanyensis]